MVISGASVLADELRDAATAAGYEVRSPHAPTGGVLPALVLGLRGHARPPQGPDKSSKKVAPTPAARPTPPRAARAWCCARTGR